MLDGILNGGWQSPPPSQTQPNDQTPATQPAQPSPSPQDETANTAPVDDGSPDDIDDGTYGGVPPQSEASQPSAAQPPVTQPVTTQPSAKPPVSAADPEKPAATPADSSGVTDHLAGFLNQMREIQDRYASVSLEEKEATRKRAASLMQSLLTSRMIEGLATPQASAAPSLLQNTDNSETDTASLAVQWYKQA